MAVILENVENCTHELLCRISSAPGWALVGEVSLCYWLAIMSNRSMAKPEAKQPRKTLARRADLVTVVLIGLVVVTSLVLKSLNSRYFVPNGWTWKRVSWRAHLFARKAEGDVPDLSWRELWFMVHVRRGFGLENFVNQGHRGMLATILKRSRYYIADRSHVKQETA